MNSIVDFKRVTLISHLKGGMPHFFFGVCPKYGAHANPFNPLVYRHVSIEDDIFGYFWVVKPPSLMGISQTTSLIHCKSTKKGDTPEIIHSNLTFHCKPSSCIRHKWNKLVDGYKENGVSNVKQTTQEWAIGKIARIRLAVKQLNRSISESHEEHVNVTVTTRMRSS